TTSYPSRRSWVRMRSESTSAFGQPRLIKPTFPPLAVFSVFSVITVLQESRGDAPDECRRRFYLSGIATAATLTAQIEVDITHQRLTDGSFCDAVFIIFLKKCHNLVQDSCCSLFRHLNFQRVTHVLWKALWDKQLLLLPLMPEE